MWILTFTSFRTGVREHVNVLCQHSSKVNHKILQLSIHRVLPTVMEDLSTLATTVYAIRDK